ncbi:unnamed protein product [Urochloa humidicola]
MRFGNGGAWPANLAGSFAVLARRRQVREKELSSTCITVELKAIFTSSAAARIESHADKHHRPSTDLSVFSPFVGTRQLSYADCNSPSRRLQELHGEQILMPTILPNLLCSQSRSAAKSKSLTAGSGSTMAESSSNKRDRAPAPHQPDPYGAAVDEKRPRRDDGSSCLRSTVLLPPQRRQSRSDVRRRMEAEQNRCAKVDRGGGERTHSWRPTRLAQAWLR